MNNWVDSVSVPISAVASLSIAFDENIPSNSHMLAQTAAGT